MQKRKSGKKWILILLVVAAAAGGLYYARAKGLIRFNEKTGDTSSAQMPKTQTAYIGSIEVTTDGNGVIEPASWETVTSEYSVRVSHVEAESGDIVKKGDLIAEVDMDSIDDRIREAEGELSQITTSIANMSKGGSSGVSASVAGRVKRIFAKKGDLLSEVVRKHGGVVELSVDGRLKVEFTTSAKLSPGNKVTVSFSGYEAEGTVIKKEGRNCTVTISDKSEYQVDTKAEIFDDDDEKIGEGVLLTNTPYLVDTRYGICDGINVSVGNSVDSGTTLLTRTNYSYNAEYVDAVNDRDEIIREILKLKDLRESPKFLAPSDGIVADIQIADRLAVAEDAAMYTLISTKSYRLKAQIDELDIAGVREGQKVSVVFDAFEDEQYDGTVEKVSALGTNTGGVTTYTVTILMDGEEKIMPGMSATATITIEEKPDALLVPIDAVRTVDGERKVTVINGETTEDRAVTLGLVSGSTAEILEGITEGTEVVVYENEDVDWMIQMMQRNAGNAQGSPFGGSAS